MFCTKCGAEIPEGAKFCIKCGAPVTPQPKAPVSPWARPEPSRPEEAPEPQQAEPVWAPQPESPEEQPVQAGHQVSSEGQVNSSAEQSPVGQSSPGAGPAFVGQEDLSAKQSQAGPTTPAETKSSSSKKSIWIGVAIALVIIIAAVVVFAVVHNKQKNNAAVSSTTAAVSQTATTKDAAASKASYLTDSSLIPAEYVEKYREDLINMIDHTNVDIVEIGFSRANDFQKVKPGHTYNSLIYVVEDGGRYGIYEYADIKIDGNDNLLPPAKFNGRVRNYDSWDKVATYLANKPGDSYYYQSIEQ